MDTPPAPPPGRLAGRGVSIRVASRLTSIPAETLRMWERRYGFPAPERDAAGVRLYSEADIDRLRVIARALKSGYRVGEVIGRDRAELEQAIGGAIAPLGAPAGEVPTVSSIVEALARDDLAALRAALRRATLTLGPRRFVTDLAGPLCTAVGEAWARGEVAVRQEHAFAAQLTSQLRLLLAAYEDVERPPVVVLATLPGELHGLGLEMVAVYLAARGAAPRLLGTDLPPEQIADAARALSAGVIGISLSAASDPRAAERQLRKLTRALPRQVSVWIGGAGASDVDVGDTAAAWIEGWTELDDAVRALGW